MKIYSAKEIDALSGAIALASQMWANRCKLYLAKHGDRGSVVIGAGICCAVKHGRHSKTRELISAGVSCAQGSLVWEESVEEVVSFLKERGLDCYYECGRMD